MRECSASASAPATVANRASPILPRRAPTAPSMICICVLTRLSPYAWPLTAVPLKHCVSRCGCSDQAAEFKIVRTSHRLAGTIDKVTSAETESGGTNAEGIDPKDNDPENRDRENRDPKRRDPDDIDSAISSTATA